MEIVEDGGVPLQERAGEVAGDLEELAHAVTVVVVLNILAPVDQGEALAGALVGVVGIDLAFAAVDFDDGGDELLRMVWMKGDSSTIRR